MEFDESGTSIVVAELGAGEDEDEEEAFAEENSEPSAEYTAELEEFEGGFEAPKE